MKRRVFLERAIVAGGVALMAAQEGVQAQTPADLDWRSFLAAHDPVWERLPQHWWEAPFVGNGLMGTQVRQDSPHSLRFDQGRADVQEHRKIRDSVTRSPDTFEAIWAASRLPVGYFRLATVGEITGGTLRLDLWNAELTGEVTTSRGSVQFRCLTHARDMVFFARLEREGGEVAGGGSEGARWEWVALDAVCPRAGVKPPLPAHFAPNPAPQIGASGDIFTCVQNLVAGGQTATAWHLSEAGQASTLFASVAHTFPDASATPLAVASVKAAQGAGLDAFLRPHRAWWHTFYGQSFLSLSDPYWEAFYWIQLYKLASATRADRALIDNQGPWLQPTPWASAWWNLNVQLTYWPALPANHPDLAASLPRHLDDHIENLILNVAPAYRPDSAAIGRATGQDLRSPCGTPGKGDEVGNLGWAMHNYWQYCRATADNTRLRDHFLPLLKRAITYYLHFLAPDADGVLHLPSTYSPEYGAGADCTYDLAILRWGLHTLLETTTRLGLDDPDRSRWQTTLDHLAPYPTDSNGYRIAATVAFAMGHRHFSHLLQAFPFHLVNRNQPGAWEIVDKTIRHWHSLGARQGYSFTGAALIVAAFGKGDRALEYLDGLRPFLQASTLYKEAGPVIETPLSAAHTIQQMLLQDWAAPGQADGVIRVFPAVPAAWPDAAFADMRAAGAFLVSAARRGGVTQFVRVKSLAGEPCRLQPGVGLAPTALVRGKPLPLTDEGEGIFRLPLRAGDEALLFSGPTPPPLAIGPVPHNTDRRNLWGLKAT